MPYDQELVGETRAWIVKSNRDLETAAYELQATEPFSEDAVFHAQQAVEKMLKGFLTWHGRAFRKTHNLIELGEQCAELDPSMEPLLRKAAPLTEYAGKFPLKPKK